MTMKPLNLRKNSTIPQDLTIKEDIKVLETDKKEKVKTKRKSNRASLQQETTKFRRSKKQKVSQIEKKN